MTGGRVDLDLSGVGVRVEGLSSPLAEGLAEIWSGFVAPRVEAPLLVVTVEDDPASLTPGRTMQGRAETRRDGALSRVARDEGGLTIDAAAGRATVRLASGDSGRRLWGLVNLIHAALGLTLQHRGGGLLHAAGIVLDGRAFVLVGAEGSGKTTFSRAAADAGVPVISDDQVIVVTTGGRCEAIAAPIRNRDFPGPGQGRWPVAAFLLPRRGTVPGLAPAARIDLMARLSANLLYVGDVAAVETIADGAPTRWLTFAPDPSFLPTLSAFDPRS